ncbi:MAG: hypothetical protein KME64_06710 [Scytonematopsis contorta HA4267-MV1]|jgi:hypothetical protein|nr:hypothetical protein [Scytonematopsis contorta HA4267-MV1]
MSERDNQYHQKSKNTHYSLEDMDLTNYWWHGGSYWSPLVRQEIFDELNQVDVEEGEQKKKSDSNLKMACLFVSTLALLSFGILTQANSVTHALRNVARISVQQATQFNNQ